MKIIAYILVINLVMLGMNRFLEVMTYAEQNSDQACEMNCCQTEHDCDAGEQGDKDEHSCPSGCDCNCCFRLVAIEYQFLTLSVTANQTMHYASFTNEYRFDYNSPVFQPPEMVN